MKEINDETRNPEDRPAFDDGALERLLRAAGHRPAVSEWDAAVVKRAARAEWRRKVEAHARRKLYRRGGAFLAAAVAVLLVVSLTQWMRPGVAATVDMVTGAVTVFADGVPDGSTAGAGEEIAAGATVATAAAADGASGRAALRLASGHSVRLDTDTRLRLVSGSVLALDHGTVYVDSGPAGAGGSIEVRTPLGVARDVGTQFEVRYQPANGDTFLRLRVREGLVVLDRDGESRQAAAGGELTVQGDGTVAAADVPRHGPLWDWVQRTAPTFDTTGRTLRELLDWAAREGGWELRFADPAVADAAAEATLLGTSLEGLGLTPEEAAATMLGASKMTYRLEDGTLLVETAAP